MGACAQKDTPMIKKTTSLIFAFIFLLTAVLFTASCSNEDPDAPKGMKLCSNDVVGFKFYVPEDWTLSMSTGAVGAYCSSSDPTNVSVMAWNLPSAMTVTEWWEQYKAEFEGVFSDFKVIDETNITMGGVAGVKYTYTAKLGDFEYYYIQAACIHSGMVYVFTFTSTPDKYESHLEEVDNMLAHFDF